MAGKLRRLREAGMTDKRKSRRDLIEKSAEEVAKTVIDLERPHFSAAPALTDLSGSFDDVEVTSGSSDTLKVPNLKGFEDSDDEDTDLMSQESLRQFHASTPSASPGPSRGSGPRPRAQAPASAESPPRVSVRIGDADEQDATSYRPRPLGLPARDEDLAEEPTLSRPQIHRFDGPRSAVEARPGGDETTRRRPPPSVSEVGSNMIADRHHVEAPSVVDEITGFSGFESIASDDVIAIPSVPPAPARSPGFDARAPTVRGTAVAETDDLARVTTQLPNTVDRLGSSAEVDGVVLIIDAPPGASVFLDGQDQGKGRVVLDDLDPFGRYSIRIHQKGYVPFSTVIELRGESERIVRPELKPR